MLLQLFKVQKVVVDEHRVKNVEVRTPTGDGEHPVVLLSWVEKEVTFLLQFTEDGLAHAEVLIDSIEIEDHEGDVVSLKFI